MLPSELNNPFAPKEQNSSEISDKRRITMTICIICSLSCKDVCEIATNVFETSGAKVHHPFLDQSGSLYKIQRRYLRAIDEADIVVAIPKNSCMNNDSDPFEPKTEIIAVFGESTSYEMAYARHIGKPVIIWGEGTNQ